ncbi:hypothetical protein [Pseudonocardia sp. NPDC049154]|uniref:hypothetical protein n=1 Tax=Pseudonocardia sp. NPDC049154 TaxID=3155501 RepID=UPI0033EB9B4F
MNGDTTTVYWVADDGDLDTLTLFWTEERAEAYAKIHGQEYGGVDILSDSAAAQLIIDTGAEADEEREHSDRARYVTEQVKLWIANDGEYYEEARGALRRGGVAGMQDYLTGVLRDARHESDAAWHVAQELAPNDYDRIRWTDVVDELVGE